MSIVIAVPRGSSTGLSLSYDDAEGGPYNYAFPLAAPLSQKPADFIPNGDGAVGRHIGLRVGMVNFDAAARKGIVRVICVYAVKIGDVTYYDLRPYGKLEGLSDTQIITSGKFVADDLTWTPESWGTFLEARAGARAATIYEADRNMAELQIPDLDNADGIILDRSIVAGDMSGGGTHAASFNTVHAFTT